MYMSTTSKFASAFVQIRGGQRWSSSLEALPNNATNKHNYLLKGHLQFLIGNICVTDFVMNLNMLGNN